MNKRIMILTIALVAVATSQVFAADSYIVIRDKFGQTDITSTNPGYAWSYTWGPYDSADAAKRAGMIGTDPNPNAKPVLPITRPGVMTSMPEDNYFIVSDKFGSTRVTTNNAGYAWSTIGGPYDTRDEAYRAAKLDPDTLFTRQEYVQSRPGSHNPQPENPWFVIKNREGVTTVANDMPGVGWKGVEGPYLTMDAAKRAGGIGDDPYPKGKPQYPLTRAQASFYTAETFID